MNSGAFFSNVFCASRQRRRSGFLPSHQWCCCCPASDSTSSPSPLAQQTHPTVPTHVGKSLYGASSPVIYPRMPQSAGRGKMRKNISFDEEPRTSESCCAAPRDTLKQGKTCFGVGFVFASVTTQAHCVRMGTNEGRSGTLIHTWFCFFW